MIQNFVLMAQGGGYYGSAFFTINHLTYDQLKNALHNDSSTVSLVEHNDDGEQTLSLFYPPDTMVTIRPWDGELQPKPIILNDSGHGAVDLHILNLKRTGKIIVRNGMVYASDGDLGQARWGAGRNAK